MIYKVTASPELLGMSPVQVMERHMLGDKRHGAFANKQIWIFLFVFTSLAISVKCYGNHLRVDHTLVFKIAHFLVGTYILLSLLFVKWRM